MLTLAAIVGILLLVLIIERGPVMTGGTIVLIILLVMLITGTGYYAHTGHELFVG